MHYSHMSTAIDFYNKCMEEHDSGRALLDIAILLESLCYFRRGELGEGGMCDSEGAINHALGQYGNSHLIKKVYQARSRRIAHSPQQSVQIDRNLLPQVQEYVRKTILQMLYDIIK